MSDTAAPALAPTQTAAPMPGTIALDVPMDDHAYINEALQELGEQIRDPAQPGADEPRAGEPPKAGAPFDAKAAAKQIMDLPEDQRAAVLAEFNVDPSAFAAMTAKSKRLRMREQTFVAEREEHKRNAEEYKAAAQEFDQLLGLAKKDPVAALKIIGWEPDEVARYLADGKVPAEVEHRQEGEARRDELKELRERLEKSERERTQERDGARITHHQQRTLNDVEQSMTEAQFSLVSRFDAREIAELVWGMKSERFERWRDGGFKGERPNLDTREMMGQIQRRLEFIRDQSRALGEPKGSPARDGAGRPANPEAGREPPSLSSRMTGERTVTRAPTESDDEGTLSDEEYIRRGSEAWA